jgi:hypothetical protein
LHEEFVRDDSAFYEFVPYKFGPYSFAAQREIQTLTAYGYVESVGSSLRITGLGESEVDKIESGAAHAVQAFVSQYEKQSLQSLLKDVYTRYPSFAWNSELKDVIPNNAIKPKTAHPAVYTIGYENCSIDGFLNRLLCVGIRRIIDVRANPVSRKYGFARSSRRFRTARPCIPNWTTEYSEADAV